MLTELKDVKKARKAASRVRKTCAFESAFLYQSNVSV